jgi:hypothetical protein
LVEEAGIFFPPEIGFYYEGFEAKRKGESMGYDEGWAQEG